MDAAIISEQGMRWSMEDSHFLDTDFGNKGWIYCGIYDGHNGITAAAYAAERVHQEFLIKLENGITPQLAFIKSYEKVSSELSEQQSGTTAVDVLIKDGVVFTANAGDARAIIIGKKKIIQLTVDHRVENAEERERVENSGGRIVYSYVSNGAGGLMPTRTLGDQSFKSVGVIATPYVNEYKISPDDLWLLVACDGLFDVMSNEEAAELARKASDVNSLLEILKTESLINRAGSDNLTMAAVRLGK